MDKKTCYLISQLSQETIRGFEEVNKTNKHMQRSIRRFDLQDSYNQFMEQKYRILQLLETNPNNNELKRDLDECRSRLSIIENELKELTISK